MAEKTGIQWTDATWNAVTGCDHVSAGCDHCYAETLSLRLQKMAPEGKYRNGFRVTLHERALTIPLKWRTGRKIFVNSMSDQWHVAVPPDFTDRMFAVMALTPHHTYQILTKRPQRAANYLNDPTTRQRISAAATTIARAHNIVRHHLDWPLPNVWIGTSVEDARVTHRIDALRKCPAAVRFLSCEPLIGDVGTLNLDGIGWVIAGGESGPDHRPCDPAWARSLRDQCVVDGTPFFFKQWGGPTPKSGGRELDGLVWSQFPTVAAVPA